MWKVLVKRHLTEDQFKCFIFVQGLESPRDTEIEIGIFTKAWMGPSHKLTVSYIRMSEIIKFKT